MKNTDIYESISTRTGGDIYIGVVGPVRTGKSTFIHNFMERLVIPSIDSKYKKERAQDELPQSAAGKTIMTTEPKFVPNESVEITLPNNVKMKTRLVDCVGYVVDDALGGMENGQPRMVKTPWSENPMPFVEAAEIGTHKVICDHSTIGLVITCDGSITDIDRTSYTKAEERVVGELKELKKPFVILLNSKHPKDTHTESLRSDLEQKYDVPVISSDVLNLTEQDITEVFGRVLEEFPVSEIGIKLPTWFNMLDDNSNIKKQVIENIKENLGKDFSIRELNEIVKNMHNTCELFNSVTVDNAQMDTGCVKISIRH